MSGFISGIHDPCGVNIVLSRPVTKGIVAGANFLQLKVLLKMLATFAFRHGVHRSACGNFWKIIFQKILATCV
jgi:hypothetical protein